MLFCVSSHGRLVFAVRANRQRRFGKNLFQRRLLVDQQITGTRSDKNFDAGRASGVFEIVNVFGRCANVKTVIDQAVLFSERQFFIQSLLCDAIWDRVGHLQETGHAPFCTGP